MLYCFWEDENVRRISNKGSVVLEMCFVIPVVVMIIFMVISLYVIGLSDCIIMGEAYTTLYSYCSDFEPEEEKEILEEKFREELMNSNFVQGISIYSDSGSIKISVNKEKGKGETTVFSREFDVCTERLRRWQMYGDVILQ